MDLLKDYSNDLCVIRDQIKTLKLKEKNTINNTLVSKSFEKKLYKFIIDNLELCILYLDKNKSRIVYSDLRFVQSLNVSLKNILKEYYNEKDSILLANLIEEYIKSNKDYIFSIQLKIQDDFNIKLIDNSIYYSEYDDDDISKEFFLTEPIMYEAVQNLFEKYANEFLNDIIYNKLQKYVNNCSILNTNFSKKIQDSIVEFAKEKQLDCISIFKKTYIKEFYNFLKEKTQ